MACKPSLLVAAVEGTVHAGAPCRRWARHMIPCVRPSFHLTPGSLAFFQSPFQLMTPHTPVRLGQPQQHSQSAPGNTWVCASRRCRTQTCEATADREANTNKFNNAGRPHPTPSVTSLMTRKYEPGLRATNSAVNLASLANSSWHAVAAHQSSAPPAAACKVPVSAA